MKLLIMFYIVLAMGLLISAFMDWLKWLDEPIVFGECVDDLEEMLDNNTSEVGVYGYEN